MTTAHAARPCSTAAPQVIEVPAEDITALESLLTGLAREGGEDRDVTGVPIAGHLVAVLLLWLERWSRTGGVKVLGAGDDARIQRRFSEALERGFAAHHDVGYYADALALPHARLSAALVAATGRTTKEQVVDRVMLEAARLLRFTELSVGQIAFRVGFEDQGHFSRQFKRRNGMSPSAFRHEAAAAPLPARRADKQEQR